MCISVLPLLPRNNREFKNPMYHFTTTKGYSLPITIIPAQTGIQSVESRSCFFAYGYLGCNDDGI